MTTITFYVSADVDLFEVVSNDVPGVDIRLQGIVCPAFVFNELRDFRARLAKYFSSHSQVFEGDTRIGVVAGDSYTWSTAEFVSVAVRDSLSGAKDLLNCTGKWESSMVHPDVETMLALQEEER